jgi:hypothetical protein
MLAVKLAQFGVENSVTARGRRSDFFCDRDWRIWFGVVVTIGWIAGSIGYLVSVSRVDPMQMSSMEAIGAFLEGAFAPLAFLWLVLGLFIQQRELSRNTDAIRITSEQSEKQTQAIAATEMNARQETFFKIAEGVKHQLGGISGMLFVSGLGPVGSLRYSREQMDDLFAHAAHGDSEIFARLFISQDYKREGGLPELLYGTDIRRRHTMNYRNAFERICRLARNCDIDDIIHDALMQSALGLLYQRMMKYDPDQEQLPRPVPSDHPVGVASATNKQLP